MSGYFYTLLVASVCGTVCMMLAWGGFERYIKYIASLICVVLLISPLREIDISAALSDSLDHSQAEPDSSVADLYAISEQMTENTAEKYIRDIVFSEFGINAVSADIKIEWGKTEAVIKNIDLVLARNDMNRAEDIKRYLFSVLGGEVRIVEE
ncbi:MAG: stage III sporulation protein AF [Clostridia bacterium]|nr:stage III sporulation protein AF [Clostridia bacterium]